MDTFKKFVIHNHKKITYIRQVECRIFPDFTGLKKGEYRASLIAPKEMFEPDTNNVMVPPVYCWHSLYESIEEARTKILWNTIAGIRKTKTRALIDAAAAKNEAVTIDEAMIEASEEEVQQVLDQVQISML